MKKLAFIAVAAMALLAGKTASAQTNLQIFQDLGRGYATTTFEMFKADNWGNTFFFIDHYYSTADDRDNTGAASAMNGSYFEIERCLNFWQDTKLGALSLQVEYDGATWGAGIFCFGPNYFMHSDDFSKTFNVALLYDAHVGFGEADTPIKFSGVWGMQDIFGVSGLRFSGFIDVWGNNQICTPKGGTIADAEKTKFSILSEPQIWYNVGQFFNCENLNIGGEIELSYNFAGRLGFMCNPAVGMKWIF